ncbi:PREDICTED: tubulin epsilon chain-like [Ceratosolen solmsi marchali]|uniref:Tubulin epsilon chain-like n=1 Tax=Ceratosolen solmsi marchali TaxID=326594 RepID=A0AAJ7DTE5_9HYME|nr:PREDICTED: tubulin epsilon chain-like [Ceratosolen solmsi marchali]
MSQFITVQVGQCGNQIGSAFWPLTLHEYGVQTTSGGVNLLKMYKNYSKNSKELSDAFSSFFYVPDSQQHSFAFKNVSDLEQAKVKARAVLVDMEDSVVSRFSQGPLSNLFDRTCTITNYPGSGNNWAVGYYTHGLEYYNRLEETIRLMVEKCDCLHGFLLMHSVGGGTGSGLGTATLKLLDDAYPHVDRFVSSVYPASTQDVITAPYNVLLATRELIEHATCVFPSENRALQDMCNMYRNGKRENADQAKYNASCLPFQDMNSIIVNMLMHLTSGSRFSGSLNTDMNELATNLVAYPNLHYIFSSISPVALTAPYIITTNNKKYYDELFTNAWSRNNQLIKVDPLQSRSLIIGAAHIYRGDASLTDIRRNIERFQSKAKFTAWSKEAMKVGLCSVPPVGHPASLLCLMNSTAISYLFKDIIHQFDKLYKKKAHIHHYLQVDQFENEDFIGSREKILSVFDQYIRIERQTPINISRLELN